MIPRFSRSAAIVAFLWMASAVRAQDAQLQWGADRPDFTEATTVLGPGILQLENGISVDHQAGNRHFSGPELMVRLGITSRFELRFGDTGLLMERGAEGHTRGNSDIVLGTKIALIDENRWRPAFSVIPLVSFPVGHGSFSSQGYDPTLKLAWSKGLPRGIGLSGNVNFSSLSSTEGRFHQRAASWDLSYDLAPGFTLFCEVFTFAPWEKGSDAAWIADTGIVKHIGRRALIDARVGRRISRLGPDYFFGFGMAFRQSLRPF